MAPLVVVWRVTERCDTACAFCAFDATLRRPRREMEADEVLRFGALVGAWALGRDVLVSWLGGEPFLWGPLAGASEALRAAGLRVSLTTNGRALRDTERRRWAAEALDEITLSLDGPPAVHDVLRRRPGLGEDVLAALRDLRARRGAAQAPRLRVNAVLLRGNIDRFGELAELAAAAGADELTFNALGGRDRPEFFPGNRLRVADVDRVSETIERARGVLPIRGGAAYLARLRAGAEGRPMAIDDCAPGTEAWFIEVDGRLSPCAFTTDDYGVPIAALRTADDLDALPARLAAARGHRRALACDDCPATHVHAKFAS